MEENQLGNFVRERRVDLNLSQEALAERVGGTASQAEISRLERGQVMMPRRARLEDLAAALDVSLGSLLVRSGWLTTDEGSQVNDDIPAGEQILGERDTEALLLELASLQLDLQRMTARVTTIERLLRPPVHAAIDVSAACPECATEEDLRGLVGTSSGAHPAVNEVNTDQLLHTPHGG